MRNGIGWTSAALATLAITSTAAIAQKMRIEGTVGERFGQRVVIETSTGKQLIDLGPQASDALSLKAGDKVVIEGAKLKNDEIRAQSITLGDGKVFIIGGRKSWSERIFGSKSGPAGVVFGDAEARKIATDRGYTITGDVRAEKKHFVAVATKDGKEFDIAIRKDGRVDAETKFDAAAAKKIVADKGYAVTADARMEGRHFVVPASKDGKSYELDVHRDARIVQNIALNTDTASKLAQDAGFAIVKAPAPEAKHYVLLGNKNGGYQEVHVHRDGTVKIARTVDKKDPRWGSMIP